MSATLRQPAPDPAWDAARKHADTVRSGLRVTVAACVALGLELNRLKGELGYQRGGDRGAKSNNFTLPWKDLVQRETGFTYVRCQDFMRAAEAVKSRLLGSRKKGEERVRLVVKTPPSTWTHDDYEAFAGHIADAFHADTFKALMADLGFGPRPVESNRAESVQTEFPFAAMLFAHDCVAQPIVSLAMSQANPEAFVRHLYELPLDDLEEDKTIGRPFIHGLRTLQHVLTRAQDEIEAAIKAKRKGARDQ